VLRNAVVALPNAAVSPLIVVPVTAFAAAAAPWARPGWWGGWGALALDLLALDLWIYFWHVALHRAPVLWRFHEVHHRDRFLDTTTALRFHFGEPIASAVVRGAVVFALAIPLAHVLAFEALLLIAVLFHHSNLRLPPRVEAALAWVVVTPSIHWVHHHRRREDTDSNYATILSSWDRIFRTRSATRRSPGMEIGAPGAEELAPLDLLALPFRPRPAGGVAPHSGS
jgi:sterol desaturase/sphingolipid hydroxylase (fatty acid hydroxylase superfamily)